MYILQAGSPCIFMKQAVHVYSEDKRAMSTLKIDITCLFRRIEKQAMSTLKIDSPCFILESGSPCLLESGSLSLFRIKAVNVYS